MCLNISRCLSEPDDFSASVKAGDAPMTSNERSIDEQLGIVAAGIIVHSSAEASWRSLA